MELDIMSALGVTTQKIKEYADNLINKSELIKTEEIDEICQQEIKELEDAGEMEF